MLHHLGQAEAEAAQVRNYHGVADPQAHEQTVQLGLLVALLRAGLLHHDLLATRFGQRAALRGGMGVVAGSVPKIADQHGAVPTGKAGITRKAPPCPAEQK